MKPIAWYDPTNRMVSTDKDSPLFTPLGQVWPLYLKEEASMTQISTLRLALEALEKVTRSNQSDHQAEIAEEAINVLRLVIDAENISSKSVAWEQFYPEMGKPKLAYLSPTESSENACYIPPQRTWVGLTDGEVDKMILLMGFPPDWITENAIVKNIVRNLEAKLRSKNV